MILFFDFETYYDKEYSLREMTAPEYILDDRFEMIICAVARDNEPTMVLSEPELRKFLQGVSPDETITVSHNALFDACILGWRYGFIPDRMLCTLSMARCLLGHCLKNLDLHSVSSFLGLGAKGDAIQRVKGMRKDDIIQAGMMDDFVEYCRNDNDLCRGIFGKLVGAMPAEQLRMIDRVTRCAVQPRLVIDRPRLQAHLENVRGEKTRLLAACGVDKGTLMSAPQFQQELERRGIEVEMKPGKLGPIPAVAKTDLFMVGLQEHVDVEIQTLATARLGLRSTLEESRAEKLLAISALPWAQPGSMPIPLRYAGAHTHRLCLVGETPIVTLRDNRVVYIRLDQLQDIDLVWDGEAFVYHGGLAYAGLKKVIEYEGVIGTPGHRVWTVERRYCSLAEAKARGHHIACGNIPDPTRVDPFVFRPFAIQHPRHVYLRAMQQGDAQPVEGPFGAFQSMVPLLPQERINAGESASPEHDGASCTTQSGRSSTPTSFASSSPSEGYTVDTGDSTIPGTSSIKKVAHRRLENSDDHGNASFSALYQSPSEQLQLLWRARDCGQVCFNSCDGRLAPASPWLEATRKIPRPDQYEQSLRTRQSTVGDSVRANGKSEFVATWDIVACGPRNRFMANGKIVHNSGEWKINMQNLPRATTGGSQIRKCVVAPPGCSIVVCDLGQIEARLVAWQAGASTLVAQFANNLDPYARLAESIFGYSVDRKIQIAEGFVGKQGILGLGYGLGQANFFIKTKAAARGQKVDLGELFTQNVADRAVKTYRKDNREIPEFWYYLSGVLNSAFVGKSAAVQVGPVEIGEGYVQLPDRLVLQYNEPQSTSGEASYRHPVYGTQQRIWGGHFLENITQALAGQLIRDAWLRLDTLGYRAVWQVHDELIFVVADTELEEAKKVIHREMVRRPKWAPDLPLSADIGSGKTYGDAK